MVEALAISLAGGLIGLLAAVVGSVWTAEALHALMGLLRDSGSPQRMVAAGGQYQQSLPQGKSYHLMRVRLDGSAGLVPDGTGLRLSTAGAGPAAPLATAAASAASR